MTSTATSALTRREFAPAVLRGAAGAFAVALFAASSRAQQSSRAKMLSARLFCACGCNQVLGSCNHVDCPVSPKMLKELDDRIARGESDDLILQDFVQEYGETVLTQPPARGFNVFMWIIPVVVPIVAIVFGWGMVQRWREHAALAPAAPGAPVGPEFLARAHRESGGSDE
jgi:cytochrome c-type biogenesis protein CcmH/NrfF